MSTIHMPPLVANVLRYSGIIAISLVLVDGVLIGIGALPPTHNYGDPTLGWRSATPAAGMQIGRCTEFSSGEIVTYQRNEDGVRTGWTRQEVLNDSTRLKIADTGDSQTDLCATNDKIHAGALHAALEANGTENVVLTFGAGRYSPLQAYLAFREVLRPYHPQVLVLNVYTGNDFYDILRSDDRPHFVATDSGYQIAPPNWFSYDDPRITRTSRVLFVGRSLGDKTGIRQLYARVSALRKLVSQFGGGVPEVFSYMRDLWRAREPTVGYPDAFSAQMLNQQLFFRHFPEGEQESTRRLRALMALVRRENPGMLLVMSPLPSYQLATDSQPDQPLLAVLERLPITFEEGVEQEAGLYETVRGLSAEEGWVFADNLRALREFEGDQRLYNDFDYHFLPVASELIGQTQAHAIEEALSHRGPRQ